MYQPGMTKRQATAAARFMIVTFHEDRPDVDRVTEMVIFHQFVRELSASAQSTIDPVDVMEALDLLDRELSLDFHTDEYTNIDTWDALMEHQHIANMFTSQLGRILDNFAPHPAHYFQTENAA